MEKVTENDICNADQGQMFTQSLANDTDERFQPNNTVSTKEINIHQEILNMGKNVLEE